MTMSRGGTPAGIVRCGTWWSAMQLPACLHCN